MDHKMAENVPIDGRPLKAASGFQRDALRVIEELDSPNGKGIQVALADEYGRHVNVGQLYPNLDDLAEKGLINKQETGGGSNEYSLTENGREALDSYRRWLAPSVGEADDPEDPGEEDDYDDPAAAAKAQVQKVSEQARAAQGAADE